MLESTKLLLIFFSKQSHSFLKRKKSSAAKEKLFPLAFSWIEMIKFFKEYLHNYSTSQNTTTKRIPIHTNH